MREITLTPASRIAPAVKRSDWGPWRLDPTTLVLFPVTPYRYEIDLEECLTSADVLDYVVQVAGKSWATDAHVAGLVRAIDDILHPQANLCSGGQTLKITRAKVAALVAKVANRWPDATTSGDDAA